MVTKLPHHATKSERNMLTLRHNYLTLTNPKRFNPICKNTLRQYNDYKNEISSKTKSKIKTRLVHWSMVSERIYFTTLTFPNCPSEQQARQKLKQFLTKIKPLYYFYSVESSGRNNIHFHLCIELQLHGQNVEEIVRNVWQSITKSNSPFQSKTKRVWDMKGLANYLLKGSENELSSKPYGNSRSLSDFDSVRITDTSEIERITFGAVLIAKSKYAVVLAINQKAKRSLTHILRFKYRKRKKKIRERQSNARNKIISQTKLQTVRN
jgi:hypothetical protein